MFACTSIHGNEQKERELTQNERELRQKDIFAFLKTLSNLSTFNYFPSLHLQKGQLFPPFIWFHAHVFHRPRLLFLAEIALGSVHFESFSHILIKLQNFELGYEIRHANRYFKTTCRVQRT